MYILSISCLFPRCSWHC